MTPHRKTTRRINIGSVPVGGGAGISIQSMTNTDTRDTAATLNQIKSLAAAGCQIIRCAVPDMNAAAALRDIVKDSPIPVIADIHFDYRLALEAIASKVHAVRINPGNIGSRDRVKLVAEAAGNAGIPIRVGANSGSLPKGLFESKLAAGLDHDAALAESLVESVTVEIRKLEEFAFEDIKVSLKASSVPVTVAAYRQFAKVSDRPLHIGVTEAGTLKRGIVKSSIGIGALLLDGIGDTLRVSLTAPPIEEVYAALAILESAGIRAASPETVSCPTCGRTNYDLVGFATRLENAIEERKAAGEKVAVAKIAVMGCAVNGPGEAHDADLGIAGCADGRLMIFKHGETVTVLPGDKAFEEFLRMIFTDKKS